MATPQESGATEHDAQADGSSEFDKAFVEFTSPEATPAHAADDQGDLDREPSPQPQSGPNGSDRSDAAAPSAPADQASDEFDLAQLPPAARTAFERLQQSERSARGRVSALDRQLHQFRQRPSEAAPAAGATVDNDTGKLLQSDQIKEFREAYPEIADPLIGLIEAQAKRLDEVSGKFRAIDEERSDEFLNRQADQLAAAMPDWATYGSDKRFESWIQTQPRHVQEAAARNNQFIVDAAEAEDVLQRFKAAVTPAAPAPPPTDPRRERQMRAGADATTKAPATVSGIPDDFDAAFESLAQKSERNRTGQFR